MVVVKIPADSLLLPLLAWMAETRMLTVSNFFMMLTAAGSMKVKLAKAAEAKRNVSADRVCFDNAVKIETTPRCDYLSFTIFYTNILPL